MKDDREILLVARRFQVVRHHQAMPDGSIHTRETVQHPGSVAIVPVLPNDRICLIRNYRIAVQQTLIEIPAGTLDKPGEDPLETAHRELIEETGYRAGRMEKICELLMSPGILNERMHVYLASELTPGAMELESGEEIETLEVAWNETRQMIFDGTIQDAKTIAGLLFYAGWREDPSRKSSS